MKKQNVDEQQYSVGGERMSFSYMLSEEKELIEKTKKQILRKITERISFSETMSIYSHLPLGKLSWRIGGLRNLTSKEALGLALVVPFIPSELKFLLRIELQDLAYHKRYEGDWMLVQKLSEAESEELVLWKFLVLEERSSREIFGNLLPLATKRLEKIELYDPNYHRRINKPQRKRGYTDHGSRKDSHRWLPTDVHLGSNPKRPDLRMNMSAKSFFRSIWNKLQATSISSSNQTRRRSFEKQTDPTSD